MRHNATLVVRVSATSAERWLFIAYCAIAGGFWMIAPWERSWDRLASLLPEPLGPLAAGPWFRGAISAFGCWHVTWSFHDLDLWWSERIERIERTASAERSAAVEREQGER